MLPVTGTGRHVLMSADAVGGIWTYALDLGAALVRRGDRVTVAVLGPAPDDMRRREATARGLKVFGLEHAPDWLAADEKAVHAAGAALARLARRERADLLHLNHPALVAKTRYDQPVMALGHSCVATWWNAVRDGPLPEDFRWRAALHERGLAAADAVAAPSRSFAEATRRVYGFGTAPLVVHNGRDRPAFGDRPVTPDASVFTAGRLWDEGKNLAVLDRAAARLPVSVEAAGPLTGPNGASVTLHHIRALGPLGETALREKLAARPIFVSSALYEPFGLAVLEAAQAGCALVLSDIPTFRELWDGAALFVPPHDDRALAAAIVRLLGDRSYRSERAEKAVERAARYTVEACVDATETAYATARAVKERRSASQSAQAGSKTGLSAGA